MKACVVRWSVVGSKTIGKPFVVYVCDWFQNKKPPPPADPKAEIKMPKYDTGYLESRVEPEPLDDYAKKRVRSLIRSIAGTKEQQ